MRSFILFVLPALVFGFIPHGNTSDVLLNAKSIQIAGKILFMRHTEAPGYGDPPGFEVRDCGTQRNLNNKGIQQAKKIGALFKNSGLSFKKVFSSEWCRCIDTAKLLSMGEVEILPALNSFFQDWADREQTLRDLDMFFSDLKPDDLPILMVTHQVTIKAVTGHVVGNGGMVVYDPKTDRNWPFLLDRK